MSSNRENVSSEELDSSPKVVQGELVIEEEYDSRKRLEALAWLLDNSIPIPGLNFRIGLDAIIGLIPGIGDLISAAVSTLLLAEASRLGVSRAIILRMAGNVLIDTIIGSVPFVGDLFDMGWKANTRNVRLLVAHLDQPRKVIYTSWFIVTIFFMILLAIIVGLSFLLVYGVSAIWNISQAAD